MAAFIFMIVHIMDCFLWLVLKMNSYSKNKAEYK